VRIKLIYCKPWLVAGVLKKKKKGIVKIFEGGEA